MALLLSKTNLKVADHQKTGYLEGRNGKQVLRVQSAEANGFLFPRLIARQLLQLHALQSNRKENEIHRCPAIRTDVD
jgi:hypothetical protein